MTREHDDSLAALLEAGRAGGRKVEQGKFRLDWTRALDKIKRFQLTDPHRYVLEVMQSAVARGATNVDVYSDADDIIMTFDGEPFTETELSRLFDYLFSQDDSFEAVKQLALGVNSALALDPKYIEVTSGDGGNAVRVTMSSHTDLEVSKVAGEEVLRGTRVHVRDRTSWRTLVDTVRTAAEVKLLETECNFAPIPVVHAGADVRAGLRVEALRRAPFEADGIRGEVALRAAGPTDAAVHLCMRGVRIVTFRHGLHGDEPPAVAKAWAPLREAGVVAWVDNPKLSRNASHSDVNRDDELVRTLGAVNSAARRLLQDYIRDAVTGEAGGLPAAASLGYVRLAMRSLLRRGRKGKLPKELDALLDVPGMVELAVEEPVLSSLRPVWDACTRGKPCTAGMRRYSLALADLEHGQVPVLGSELEWLGPIFRDRFEFIDDELSAVERGQMARRQREADKQEAALPQGTCLVQTVIGDDKLTIRGELGLIDPARPLSLPLSLTTGDEPVSVDPGPAGVVRAVCLRDGVPLGVVDVECKVSWGFAVVDSPDFEPTDDWTDVAPGKVVSGLADIFDREAPGLLRLLAQDFPELPPPVSTMHAGGFAALTGTSKDAPTEVTARWPGDFLSALARTHVEQLMRRLPKRTKQAAPWLWSWHVYRDLEGGPLSLSDLAKRKEQLRVVTDLPWGPGAPEDMLVVNGTAGQGRVIRRYLGKGILSGKKVVERRRKALAEQAARAETRRRNLAAAEAQRGDPVLAQGRYVAVVPLEGKGMVGQVGLPRADAGKSYIRYYVNQLPLPVAEVYAPIAVHAAVAADGVTADPLFAEVAAGSKTRPVITAVLDAIPALLGALARTPAGTSEHNLARMWQYLASFKKKKKHAARREAVVEALRAVPLIPTVDRGRISMADVLADAEAHRNQFLYTRGSPFRQLTERPIVMCKPEQAAVLRRVLDVRAKDYTRDLDGELEVLAKLDRPRRKPELVDTMAIEVKIEGEGITGVMGIPLSDSGLTGMPRTLEVLRSGVPIMREALVLHDLPLLAVVDCPALQPNKRWDDVTRDATWKRVSEAVDQAVTQLVTDACASLARPSGGLRERAIARALRDMAARSFRGRARLFLDSLEPLEATLAQAPLWANASLGGDQLSTLDLAEFRKTAGLVWFVRGKKGRVRPERVIVDVEDSAAFDALSAIFGKGLREGDGVLRRDEEAHRRRQSAPLLTASLSYGSAWAPVSFENADGARLEFAGQAGVERSTVTGPPGIRVRFGIEGRLLFERTFPHPVHGLAHVECPGLKPNNEWTGPRDQGQVNKIVDAATTALWDSVDQLASSPDAADAYLHAAGGPKRAFVHALTALFREPDGREALRDTLASLPLLHTVERRALSPQTVIDEFGSDGKVKLVSEQLGVGTPEDGAFILRCSPDELALVEALPLGGIERYDDAWGEQLAGQRRRKETPQEAPNLDAQVLAEVYFQNGTTSGVAGLLPVGVQSRYDDDADPRSRIRLHLDRRKVAERAPRWNPAIEVWVNDDRLTPTASFLDVKSGPALVEVMATAAAQIPELLARAAVGLRLEDSTQLRLRLCHWVCDRFASLAKEAGPAPKSAAGRLLSAPIWDACTRRGVRRVDTNTIAKAHDAGKLGVVAANVTATTGLDEWILVRATDEERRALAKCFGELEDHTDAVERGEAHRAFLARRTVGRIDLDTRRGTAAYVWRRAIEGDGWQGEIGIRAEAGNLIDMLVFSEGRSLCGVETVGPCSADVAVQYDGLMPNATYDGIVFDDAYRDLVSRIRRDVALGLQEMAASLDEVPRRAREGARFVLLRSLSLDGDSGLPTTVAGAVGSAPLLRDVAGTAWSVNKVRDHMAATEQPRVLVVDPAVAKRGEALGDRLVLSVSDGLWPPLSQVLPLERYDQGYERDVAARERRDDAPTSYRISRRRSLARTEVTEGPLTGELALSVPAAPGVVALFSGGRMVEERTLLDMFGLVGHLDGPWSTDREFTSVAMTKEHRQAMRELYFERLAAAAELAARYDKSKRSRTWAALCDYAVGLLSFDLRRVGRGLGDRRDMVVTHSANLPARLRTTLSATVFQTTEGDWVDLATLIAGDDPEIVIAEERVKQKAHGRARFVVGDIERLKPLFEAVVGARNVSSYERWKARRKSAAKAKRPKKHTPEALDGRALSAVQSVLRDVLGQKKRVGGIKRTTVNRIKLGDIASGPLASWDGERITVNKNHAVWKAGRSAPLGPKGMPSVHLAAAILGDLARIDNGPLSGFELTALYVKLARVAKKL